MRTGNLGVRAPNVGSHGDIEAGERRIAVSWQNFSDMWTRKLLDWEGRRREPDGGMACHC